MVAAPLNNDLQWFEKFYLSLKGLQHKDLIRKLEPDAKASYLKAIMPSIMTVGRLPYSCHDVYHPGKSCRAYFLDKIIRSTLNCLKITLIASLLPQIIKKRKHLFQSGDIKVILRTLRLILIRYIRATLFLLIGTSLPFITVCFFPLSSLILTSLSQAKRITVVYGTLPILSLIVDVPTKMPGYMGFFVSKSISMGWSLLKTYKIVPSGIPFEK